MSLALQESNNDTLLHRAVRKESVRVINYLLSEGVDPTLVNNNGETAVHLAAGKYCILDLFFNHYRTLCNPVSIDEPVTKKIRLTS